MANLQTATMEEFGSWLSIDLAKRNGQRGRRQTEIMAGVFSAWSFPQGRKAHRLGQIRETDFSFRVALLVHGWRTTGLTCAEASERVAEYPMVQTHLGKSKRGRHSIGSEGVTEKDETTRIHYYKFRKNHPDLAELLKLWFSAFRCWRKWALSIDEKVVDFVAMRYRERGEPEKAEQFEVLVKRIRSESQRRLVFYHRTTPEAAQSILTGGFKNGTGKYMTDRTWSGVWLSEAPLDQEEARLSAVLQITFDSDVVGFDFYEWVEEEKPYREWLIPAAIVNTGRVELFVEPDEASAT